MFPEELMVENAIDAVKICSLSTLRVNSFMKLSVAVVLLYLMCGTFYRVSHGSDTPIFPNVAYRLAIAAATLIVLYIMYITMTKSKQLTRDRLVMVAILHITYCALHTLHVAVIVEPFTLLSPVPVCLWTIAQYIAFSSIEYYTEAGQSIIWSVQIIISGLIVWLSGLPLEFKVATPVTAMNVFVISAVVSRYITRCVSLSWTSISALSLKCQQDRVKMMMILDEMLPGDILNILRTMDVTMWHEISKSHDSVAIVLCSIKNLPELVENLKPKDLVAVIHTVFSSCDRILNMGGKSDIAKIETVHGNYLAASGLMYRSKRYVFNAYEFASTVVGTLNGQSVRALTGADYISGDLMIEMSAGVSVGPAISGVIGSRWMPRFNVFGTIVDTAARLMQHADPGTVRAMVDNSNIDEIVGLRDPNVISRTDDIGHSPEHVTVSFNIVSGSAVRARGLSNDLHTWVLMPCSPRQIAVPTEKFRLKSALSPMYSRRASRVTSPLGIQPSVVNKIAPESSGEFYQVLSTQLGTAVAVCHWTAFITYLFHLIYDISRQVPLPVSAFLAFVVLFNAIAQFAYRKCIGTRSSLKVGVINVCFMVVLMAFNPIAAGAVNDVHQPDFYYSYGFDVIGLVLLVTFAVYRLPVRHLCAASVLFSITDMAAMAYLHASVFLLFRFITTLFIGMIAIALSHSVTVVYHRLYEEGCLKIMTLDGVSRLVERLLPPHAAESLVRTLDGSGGIRATSSYSPLTNKVLRSTYISPLVAPFSGAESSSRWQQYDRLVVIHSDIVNFTASIQSVMSNPVEFFGIIRDVYAMIDECAISNGLWNMYTRGDAVITVAGFPNTISYDNPDAATVQFCIDVLDGIASICQTCQSKGYPEIALRIGLAAGSAVTAIVGEYRPAYLIWGQAPDRAAEMEMQCAPGRVLAHSSIPRAYARLSGRAGVSQLSDDTFYLLD